MKRVALTAAMALCFIWVAVAVLFLGLKAAIADEEWFLSFYTRYGTYEVFGISPTDCARALDAMIDYMEGEREGIQLTVTEFSREVEMFNEQEIVHMVDVRELYQGFERLTYLSPAACAVIALCAYLSGEAGKAVKRSLGTASGIVIAAALFFGVWVAVDFSSFWTVFHHVFFTNELWLMDYMTCRMIRICPLSLFYSIVLRMAAFAAGIAAALAAAGLMIYLVVSPKRRRAAK